MTYRAVHHVRSQMDNSDFWNGFLAGTIATLFVCAASIWCFSALLGM